MLRASCSRNKGSGLSSLACGQPYTHYISTDRQTDRQYIHTQRQTDRLTQTHRQTDRQTDTHTHRVFSEYTTVLRESCSKTRGSRLSSLACRQPDSCEHQCARTHTHTHTHTHAHTHARTHKHAHTHTHTHTKRQYFFKDKPRYTDKADDSRRTCHNVC